MTIKGELKDIKLPDIFQMVAMQQQEGTLIVSDGETKKWLYFSEDGLSLLSSGKRRPTPLGQMLLRAGRITEKQLDDALAVWRRTGKRLGEVLCDFGLTTQTEIEAVVQQQIAEEIYDMLDWQGTTFEFIPGPPPEEFSSARGDRRDLKFDVNTILLEAARRADEWDKIEDELGSINEIFVRNQLQGASADLEGDALAVYPMIDGSRTVHDIVVALRLPKADVGRAMLSLLEVGLVRRATREEIMRLTTQPGIEEHGERLARLLELAISREEDMQLRKRLADVYEDIGRLGESAYHHRVIAGAFTEQYKLAEAAEHLREATRLAPEDVETREQLIELYIRLTNMPHAVLHLKRLAKQHLDANAQAKALACLRRALELAPDDVEGRKQVVDLLIEIKDVDTALDECILLEQAAKTQAERDEARDRYGRLLALAPNLTEAKRRLAGLTEMERQKVRSKRGVRRLVAGVVLIVVVGASVGTLLYLRQRRVRQKESRREDLLQKKEYDKLEDLLAGDNSKEAAQLRKQIQDEKRREEEARRKKFRDKEAEARAHYRAGRYNLAAKAYLALAEEYEKDGSAWRAEDMKEKARTYEEQWQHAVAEKKQIQEMLRMRQFKEAHEQSLRIVERAPALGRALEISLPIYVTSVPRGASISVNGLPSGETPRIVYKQPGSPVRIGIEKAGHKARVESITDETVWRISVTLPRDRRWVFATAGAIEAGPLYHDDVLYVGSRDSILYALDGRRGSEKWRFSASDDIMTTPAIANGHIFFGTSDGTFYAVDLATHKPSWTKRVRGFIRSAPAVVQHNGSWMVLFGASDAKLYAYEAASGKQKWSYTASHAIETAPCVHGQSVFVADDGGQLYAISLGDGELLWRFQADGPIYSSPHTQDGCVFVASEKGTVYAVDAETGKERWKHNCGSPIRTSLAVGKSSVYAGCEDGDVLALNAKTGGEAWQFTASAAVTGPPIVHQSTLYFGCGDGTIYALAESDGTIRWETKAAGAVRAPTALSEHTIYIGSDDKQVHAFAL